MNLSRGTIYMFFSVLCISLMAVMVKATGSRIPPEELVLARSIVVLAITGVMLKRAGLPLLGRDHKWLLLRGVFGFLGLSAYFYTLSTIPIADATTLLYTNPLFTALLAQGILKEANPPRNWGYFLLAFSGILLIVRPGFSMHSGAALIGLGGAFCAGMAYTIVRRLRATDHPLSIVFYLPAVSIVLSVPFVARSFVMPQGWEWLMLLGIGITTQIGQVFMTRGLHYETAARATNVSYVGVVFAAGWGILLFDEIPDWRTVLGAAIVIFAVLRVATYRPPAPVAEE